MVMVLPWPFGISKGKLTIDLTKSRVLLVTELIVSGTQCIWLFSICRLVGDVLLATAFLSYSGPFNQEYRGLLNRNWMKELKSRKIPFTANLNLIEMLTDPTQVTRLIFEALFTRNEIWTITDIPIDVTLYYSV